MRIQCTEVALNVMTESLPYLPMHTHSATIGRVGSASHERYAHSMAIMALWDSHRSLNEQKKNKISKFRSLEQVWYHGLAAIYVAQPPLMQQIAMCG